MIVEPVIKKLMQLSPELIQANKESKKYLVLEEE